MKKLLFILIQFILTSTLYAEELRTLVMVKNDGTRQLVIRNDTNSVLPTRIKDKKVQEVIEQLNSGSEAFIEGHIEYEYVGSDNSGSMHPYFVIEAIHPVSLKEIGEIGNINLASARQDIFSSAAYAPLTIPVTAEVASAMTMTTGFLLMESLANSGDPAGRRDMTKALIISSGMMATLLFIYEQIEGKTKP